MRVSVAKTSDIPPGERGFVEAGGNYLVVFNVGGTYYAVEDVCTHDDGPLGDGPLIGYEIECPRHGARFDIRTGKVTRLPAITPIQWFPVHVVNDEIQIDVSD